MLLLHLDTNNNRFTNIRGICIPSSSYTKSKMIPDPLFEVTLITCVHNVHVLMCKPYMYELGDVFSCIL